MLTKAFINNLYELYCDKYDIDHEGNMINSSDTYKVIESKDDDVGGLTLQVLIKRAEMDLELVTIFLSPSNSYLEYSLNVSDHMGLYKKEASVTEFVYETFRMEMIELFA